MNKIISVIKYIVGWPLSAISLFFIFKLIYSNVSSINALGNINYFLLFLGILFFLLYFFLRSVLWHELVKEKGNKFSYKKTAYFWEISEIKRYTPGNIWSFLSRSRLFTENNNLETKDMVSTLFNETILTVLSCFTISYFYISYLFHNELLNIILLILSVLAVFFYVFSYKLNLKLEGIFERIKILLPGTDYFLNFKFYLIAVASFLAFGLANYFSASSVFYIDPRNILVNVSLFVLSLLVGYLSIITPMGLGVREGVMTFGLSYFIPISTAGLLSIFTRIIFILTEVIFLGIIFAWVNIKRNFINKLEEFILRHKYEVLLILFIFIYVLYFTVASFLRYDNFYTGRFDLGNMDQVVWNTTQGRIFELTNPDGTEITSRLAFHSDFILILLSPLYLIWSDPRTLLFVQSLVLGLGAVFVYLISERLLKNKNISLVFSLLYLLNPSLGYVNLYDFHPVALGTTFLLATFFYYLKRDYKLFLIFAFLAAITKEQVWVIISLFGLAIALRGFKKNLNEVIFGGGIFLISIVVFYSLISYIIPAVRGGTHFALSYYSDFGSSISDIIKNIVFSPLKTFSIAFNSENLSYLSQIFLPLGFLPLLSPLILVFAVPDLTINLLSNNAQLHQIYYQYTSTITPFLFIASIFSVVLLKKYFPKLGTGFFIVYLITATLLSAYFFGPLPGSKRPNIDMFSKQLTNRKVIEEFIDKIPERYSIAATNNLGSHLSRRQLIYTIPVGIDKADIILFLLNDATAQPSLEAQKEMAKKMEKDKNYILVFKNGDFVVFQKKQY